MTEIEEIQGFLSLAYPGGLPSRFTEKAFGNILLFRLDENIQVEVLLPDKAPHVYRFCFAAESWTHLHDFDCTY